VNDDEHSPVMANWLLLRIKVEGNAWFHF